MEQASETLQEQLDSLIESTILTELAILGRRTYHLKERYHRLKAKKDEGLLRRNLIGGPILVALNGVSQKLYRERQSLDCFIPKELLHLEKLNCLSRKTYSEEQIALTTTFQVSSTQEILDTRAFNGALQKKKDNDYE